MNHKLTFLIVVLLTGVFSTGALAQKVERERRISPERFPLVAHQYLDQHFADRSLEKLYLETGSSGIAYEAKFFTGNRKYSVKFLENGAWLDTEKEIEEEELPAEVKENISVCLTADMNFVKSRLLRIQEQTSVHGLRYEIELKGKSGGKTGLYEFLFDAAGKYLRHEAIILESFTNEF